MTFVLPLLGNPNVGKSTIFNALTGMHQHTGNWPGKTVSNAIGSCNYNNKIFKFIDIPGTYSIMSNSKEEEIARDYICFEKPDLTVIILDATCIERNLNLVYQIMEITPNIIVCVNLLDEAKKKHININLELLEECLGVPVVGTTARKPKTINNLLSCIYKVCTKELKCTPNLIQYSNIIEDCISNLNLEVLKAIKDEYISKWVCLKLIDGDTIILDSVQKHLNLDFKNNINIQNELNKIHSKLENNNISSNLFKDIIVSDILNTCEEVSNKICTFNNKDYNYKNKKIDKILTSKKLGIPIMLLFFAIIFWITIIGANYPSKLLNLFFNYIQSKLFILFNILHIPNLITDLLINGVYKTVTWIIAVMLPPMAIFFPLFTFLEDLGYLPRIAFNLDNYFKKACTTRKTSINYVYGIWL